MAARLEPLRLYEEQWSYEARAARGIATEEWAKWEAAIVARDWSKEITKPEPSGASSSSSSSSSSLKIDWDQWHPWFRPDCSLCRKEVEELLQMREEQQQQQRRWKKAPSSGSAQGPGAAAAAGELLQMREEQQGRARCSTATWAAAVAEATEQGRTILPWDWHEQQQQQQEQQQEEQQKQQGEHGYGQEAQHEKTAGAAAAAGGGGGGNGDVPPLHGSCYGAWPVPWDCPFRYRRLMWRLMGRVKPTALRWWADTMAMCAHCPDELQWQGVVSRCGGGGSFLGGGGVVWLGGFVMGGWYRRKPPTYTPKPHPEARTEALLACCRKTCCLLVVGNVAYVASGGNCGCCQQ